MPLDKPLFPEASSHDWEARDLAERLKVAKILSVAAVASFMVSSGCAIVAKATGWRAFVVDPRARFAQPARFPDAEQVVAAWPEEAFQRLGGIDRATAIAVLTHDPKLDDAALVLALRSNAGYIGAMGSRRAQAKRREGMFVFFI